ncbi:MAG: hypothetical protein V1489_01705, partial [Candidatus Liptonbacteria bacterium]
MKKVFINKPHFAGFYVFVILAAAAGFLAFLSPEKTSGAVGVPQIISYQGRLSNAGGNLLGGASGTSYYFRFSIYSASTAGTKIWPTGTACTHTRTVREGVFTAGIGDTLECADVLDFNFQDYNETYLEIQVSSDDSTFETLTPRQKITSSGYAINASTTQGYAPGSNAGQLLKFDAFSAGDILYASSDNVLARLAKGSNGQVLKLSGDLPSWSADLQSSGGAGAWATSTDGLYLYPEDTSDVVVIGSNATTSDWLSGTKLEIVGGTLMDAATSTNLYTTILGVNSEYFTDLTGTGLSLSSGALTVDSNTFFSLASWFATTSARQITTLANLVTVGTLTSGSTGAGFTVNLDSSTLTCTDCIKDNDIDFGTGANQVSTDDLTEGSTNLYYTDARARSALSESITGIDYNSGTGAFSLTTNYIIPKTASTTNWNNFYDNPSTVITAGDGIDWSTNTLNVDVTGDWTGTIDGNNFAGGAIGAGELIYGGSAGSFSELAAGTSGYILMSDGSAAPSWVATSTFILSSEIDTFAELDAIVADGDLAVLSSAMTGTFDGIDFTNGVLAQNALWYGGAGNAPSELALGTSGFILASSGGLPAWTATTTIPLAGDVSGTLSATVVGDDSHAHTGATISGLAVADFTSPNLSLWTNDSNFIALTDLSAT